MRHLLTILTLLILTEVSAQNVTETPQWKDTTFILVNLQDKIKGNKIVVVNVGQKAIIYLNETLLRQSAIAIINDFNKDKFSKIVHFLDSASLTNDTIIVDKHLTDFDYLVSEQLQKGNAKVFYKRLKSFMPSIYHRQEKYGMYAYRFFYLPDKRPFFATMEVSGIIEGNQYFSDRSELIKVAEKLASLRKE